MSLRFIVLHPHTTLSSSIVRYASHVLAIHLSICLSTSGDDFDLLTSAVPTNLQLWTCEGDLKAVLTRGKRWDRIFKPFWPRPIANDTREKMVRKKVEVLIRALNLGELVGMGARGAVGAGVGAGVGALGRAGAEHEPGQGIGSVGRALAALLVEPTPSKHPSTTAVNASKTPKGQGQGQGLGLGLGLAPASTPTQRSAMKGSSSLGGEVRSGSPSRSAHFHDRYEMCVAGLCRFHLCSQPSPCALHM